MARRANSRDNRYRFSFLGWQTGWYVLRLPDRLAPLELHAYQNQILEWLIEQDITPNILSYLANGNTGDGPVVPAMDGDALCLLLRRAPDVLRFSMQFRCWGITPEAMFAALHAEASVHKFVLGDLTLVAYDAIRRFVLVYGDDFPEWDDLMDDEQQFFLQLIREYFEDPTRSAVQMHEAWLDRRRLEGWRYAPEVDLTERLHPSMVPFSKLSEREQAQTRLTGSVITSLAPMLK
jgi:RyR domain